MEIESYTTTQLSANTFQFRSEGPNGTFEMIIDIVPLVPQNRIFNLGFAVWNQEKNRWDDTMQTNNGDVNLILGTVAIKALEFLDKNKNSSLMAAGSVVGRGHRTRTRLYQRGINAHFDYLSKRYNIYGLIVDRDEKGEIIGKYPAWQGEWLPFEKRTNYDVFLLNLK